MHELIWQSCVAALNYSATEQHEKYKNAMSLISQFPDAVALMESPRIHQQLGLFWTGQNLKGSSIQIVCDHGIGDFIQSLRYIKQLKDQGCKIYVNCFAYYNELNRLVRQFDFIDHFSNIAYKYTDYWTNLMYVPFALNHLPYTYPPLYSLLGERSSIPEAPLIESLKNKFFTKDTEEYKIGIAWHSNLSNPLSKKKSVPIEYFSFLKDRGRIHSLLPTQPDVDWVVPSKLNDLQDTAELIDKMDEVYSVDTAVLHLAGSMRKLTTAILCKEHDPRWKSKWYPTVKCVIVD